MTVLVKDPHLDNQSARAALCAEQRQRTRDFGADRRPVRSHDCPCSLGDIRRTERCPSLAAFAEGDA